MANIIAVHHVYLSQLQEFDIQAFCLVLSDLVRHVEEGNCTSPYHSVQGRAGESMRV